MNRSLLAISAALGIGAGLLAVPASAAPAIGADAGDVKARVATASPVEQARWHHRCWHDRWGHRQCRRVWIGPGYGYGPGVDLYVGGGRGHHDRGHGYRGDGHMGGHGYRGGGHMGGHAGHGGHADHHR